VTEARVPLVIVDGDNVAHVRGGGEDYEQVRAELVAAVVDHANRAGTDTVLVFDGHGRDRALGRVAVRYAGGETADTLIERLAHRSQDQLEVTVVSSDTVLRHVAQRGPVQAMSAREYVDRLAAPPPGEVRSAPARQRYQLADSLDPEVRAVLEQLRRGRGA
jgi:predicted RNA-binding protein with PIN domain